VLPSGAAKKTAGRNEGFGKGRIEKDNLKSMSLIQKKPRPKRKVAMPHDGGATSIKLKTKKRNV
jgi:hypothetical protein